MLPAVSPSIIRERKISQSEFAKRQQRESEQRTYLADEQAEASVRCGRTGARAAAPEQLANRVDGDQQSRAERTCAVMLGVERKQRIHDGHPEDVHDNDEENRQKRGGTTSMIDAGSREQTCLVEQKKQAGPDSP